MQLNIATCSFICSSYRRVNWSASCCRFFKATSRPLQYLPRPPAKATAERGEDRTAALERAQISEAARA